MKVYKSKYAEFYYLRSEKSWVVEVRDENGYECFGGSYYVYRKDQAIDVAFDMSEMVKKRLNLDYVIPVFHDVQKYGFTRMQSQKK